MMRVWYAIGELSDLISPPKCESCGLECLSIVNEKLGDVIHELEEQLQERRCRVKTQEKAGGSGIPLKLAMDHINQLDKLNRCLREAAVLTAFAGNSPASIVSIVSFISEQYEKLSADFMAEIKSCVIGEEDS